MAKTKMPPPTPEDFDWQAAALQQRHLALLPTSSPQELAYQKWHRGNSTERSWSQLSYMERAEWAQFYFDIETQDLYWEVDEQAQYRTPTRWTFFCKNKSEKEYVSPYQKLEEWQWKMEVEKVEAAEELVGEMKTYGLPGYVSPYALFTQIKKRRVREYKSPYAMCGQMRMGAGYQKAVIPKKRLVKAAARKQQNLGTGEQGTNGPGEIARELLAAMPEVSKKRARPVARKSKPSADEQRALVPRTIAPNPVPHVELTSTPSALAARFLAPSPIPPGIFYRSSFAASTHGPVTRPKTLAPTTTAPNSIPPRALSQNPGTSHTLKPNHFAPMIATPRIEPPIHQFSRELPKAMLFHIYRAKFQSNGGNIAPPTATNGVRGNGT